MPRTSGDPAAQDDEQESASGEDCLRRTTPGMARHFIPISEAQRALGGVGRTSVYALVAAGRIHLVKIGRRSLLSVLELKRLARELEVEAGIDLREEPWGV